MKICKKCLINKDLDFFALEPKVKDGRASRCKPCKVLYAKNHLRTKNGLVTKLFNTQCATSKKRFHPIPDYTRREFIDWVLAEPDFDSMFDDWESSGFDTDMKPSIDRLDDYVHYMFSNIRLVTWRENREKAYADRRNGINNKRSRGVESKAEDGTVTEYHSLAFTGRELNMHPEQVSRLCNSGNKNSDGMSFKFM